MCSINCYCEEYEASRTVDPQPDVNDADDVITASNPHDEREKQSKGIVPTYVFLEEIFSEKDGQYPGIQEWW